MSERFTAEHRAVKLYLTRDRRARAAPRCTRATTSPGATDSGYTPGTAAARAPQCNDFTFPPV